MGRNEIAGKGKDQTRSVIGILGMAGSGKSQVAAFLRRCGVPVVRLGDAVENEVIRRGLERNAESEALVRRELREEFGVEVLARRALAAIEADSSPGVFALDGVYSPEEDGVFRASLGNAYFTIAILCDRVTRYARLAARAHRPLTHEQALQRDLDEIHSLRKADCIVLADHFVLNNAEFDDLLRSVLRKIVDQLRHSSGEGEIEWMNLAPEKLVKELASGRGARLDLTWLLLARAEIEDSAPLTREVCRLIGDLRYERGTEFLKNVGAKDDVKVGRSSLHRVAAESLAKLSSTT